MTFQGFRFPNQNTSCLANSTFAFCVHPEGAHWQTLPLLGWQRRVSQSAGTPGCSFEINTWCISVSLWSPLCFDWADCLQQAALPFICPPPAIKRLSGVVIKTWCLTLEYRTVSVEGSLGCNLQYIINTGEVQHWKSISCSRVCWYMLLWYFNC